MAKHSSCGQTTWGFIVLLWAVGSLSAVQSATLPKPSSAPTRTIYVSPSGSDQGIGTTGSPLATVHAAIDRARSLKAGRGSMIIHLFPGTYRLESTLELGASDGGDALSPLVIEGDATGEVRLTGAKVLTSLMPLAKQASERISEVASGHLWAAQLPLESWGDIPRLVATGFGRPLQPHCMELLFKRKVMPLAGWPDGGFTTIQSVSPDDPAHNFMVGAGARPLRWMKEPDLWAYGYWNQDWRDSYESVRSVDPASGLVQLGTGPVGMPKSGQRVRFINALCELDQPGEWYLDRTLRTLYFWPPVPPKQGDVELTHLPVLINANGSRHILIRRLTLDGSRSTAIQFKNVAGVTITDCIFENIGGSAVDLDGSDCLVQNCSVRDTGEGGIYLSGGIRQTLVPGRLIARGNRLTRFNRWGKCYRPGVQLSGVGNTAESNTIENAPHSGVLFYGNDHRIICNHISRVCLETGDAGAIYSGRDWTCRGTTIEQNLIEDIGGSLPQPVAGIYLDDQLSGIVVRNNLLRRVHTGILLGGGREIQVKGNWFDQCKVMVYMDARGLTSQHEWVTDPASPLRKGLSAVPYLSEPYRKYPGLSEVMKDRPGAPVGVALQGNRAVGQMVFDIRTGASRWQSESDNLSHQVLPIAFPGDCKSNTGVEVK